MIHLINVCRYKKVVLCQTVLQSPKLHLGIEYFEGCFNQNELEGHLHLLWSLDLIQKHICVNTEAHMYIWMLFIK